jgi:hypothetical protein
MFENLDQSLLTVDQIELLTLTTDCIAQNGVKQWSRAAQKSVRIVELVNTLSQSSVPFPERVVEALRGSKTCPRGNDRKYGSIYTDWKFCAPTGKCPCAAESVSKKCKENIDHDARLVKTRATMLERYGVDNAFKLEIDRQKIARRNWSDEGNRDGLSL